MFFENAAGWSLFWLNCSIYTLLVVVRAWVDVIVPARFFDPDRWLFRTREWERGGDIYRIVRIDRWKDKLPSLSTWDRFSKKHLNRVTPRYLQRFVFETCRAESNHLRAIVSVVLMRLWTPLDLWLTCLVIALIGNIPFILIQRYNRPRLQRILARMDRRVLATAPEDGEPELRPAPA